MLPAPKQITTREQFKPMLAMLDAVLITTEELAKHWRLSPQHVHNMRRLNTGPAFLKLPTGKAGGAVRYRLAEVMAWELYGHGGGLTVERVMLAMSSAPGVAPGSLVEIENHLRAALEVRA